MHRQTRGRAPVWLHAAVLCALAIATAGPSHADAGTSQPAVAQKPAQLTPQQQAEFGRAQKVTEQILASAEFQREAPTLWDRLKTKLLEAIERLFMGIDRVSSASPWLGRALEWLLFLAAAVGLLVWVLRNIQRQRLRMALGGEPAKTGAWARESDDWRKLAEEQAARGAWREAIHALYWASIVRLEQRRLWRHNPARTPREYVRLLKAGSAEMRELRELTTALERSWYGQREATAEEFAAARQSFERLAQGGGEPLPGGAA